MCNLSLDNFKLHVTLTAATPERAIWSCDIGQWIPCSDSCQLTTTWMCNIGLKALTLARKCEIAHWLTCGADGQVDGRTDGHVRKFGYTSSRIFENIPQNGPEHSHRNQPIARFLVTAVRKNIGGSLSWLVSLSSSVPELTRHGLGRGLHACQSLGGGGCCKSVVLSVSVAPGESVHSSCLSLVCHVKFF